MRYIFSDETHLWVEMLLGYTKLENKFSDAPKRPVKRYEEKPPEQ